ncbi:MAG: glycosyltransferase family 2 protein [Eubacteriales bacterium]|nr:glycosyltransferase family 2 protein [Eubacteriales bacterium]
MEPILYFIIPCYNEEAVLPLTFPGFRGKLTELIQKKIIHENSRILYVDDGSSDQTWEIIQKFAAQDEHIAGIRQSRNRGQQNALLAGLLEALKYADLTITMDCDGQDDIQAVNEMLAAYEKGAEIVYGVRRNRKRDNLPKRLTSRLFYRLMNWLGAESIYDHGDYRLVSARALRAFVDFKEVNLFLRGMFPLVGFQSTCVYYERKTRAAGRTHYPIKKMAALALDGITGFSVRPLRIITGLGLLVSLFGFGAIVWAVATHFLGYTVDGWTSMICMVAFLGGIQLLALGILGEYIGKIYMEAKGRPRYIISEYAGKDHLQEKEMNDNKTLC